jgi:hypothetical protein
MDETDGKYIQATPDDCMNSIAERHGFFWETLWNDGKNADLKNTRKNPNVLNAGDQVWIPALSPKQESRATDARHKFKRKGVPAITRFCFMSDGKPRANEPWVMDVDGKTYKGNTDGDGVMKVYVPPGATDATITIGEGKKQKIYPVQLGSMDPVETDSGVRKRLRALGYNPGSAEEDGDGMKLKQAVRKFQAASQMKLTGNVDDALRDKLKQKFGC